LTACGVDDPGVEPTATAPAPASTSEAEPRPDASPSATEGAVVRLLAAGDIAGCDADGDEATAALLDRLGGTVAALGDLAYDRGTAEQFEDCYGPSWGRHRARTRPAIGNHDLQTEAGGPYFDYFGAAAGTRGEGWYGFDLSPAWHAIVLNSNCWAVGCDPGDPQHEWLVAELRAHEDQHVVAWMHHPRWASGHRGSNDFVQPLFAALADGGADVVLAGHEHHYERFTPVDADGRPDPDGLRSFVVGTGGFALYALADHALPITEVRSNEHFGVLELELADDGYAWRFVTVGGAVTDEGEHPLPVSSSGRS
jgi:alkaline phosphatase